jgi:outer membrane protein OmpU
LGRTLRKRENMKKILLATTLLAGFAGVASAQDAAGVTLSGDARMGIIDDFGSDGAVFTSRARVKFTLAGTTDGGLEFGAEFRADNAGSGDDGAEEGLAGKVFIKGGFGTLSMGDVDGAALAAVGHVDGVGLTGLSDTNESVFLSQSDLDESILYEYSTGNLAFYASASQREEAVDVLSIAVKYSTDAFAVALGYETADLGAADVDHLIIGAETTFSNVTLKARYGTLGGDADGDQMAVSATYAMDAISATIFYNDEDEFNGTTSYGIGGSYDLGGGASVKGGYANVDLGATSEDAFDLGIAMEF